MALCILLSENWMLVIQWRPILCDPMNCSHPTPVLLPGKSHGRRRLVGCSPWGREESNMTERFHFHFSLSCIGEGNGKQLQCSCLENPRDGGAWWAAIYGVAQSRTQLKRLSSSSSSLYIKNISLLQHPSCGRLLIWWPLWSFLPQWLWAWPMGH